MRKIYFYIILGVLSFLALGIAIFKKPKNVKVTTLKDAYSIVSNVNEKDYLYVRLFVNERNTFYTDASKIKNSKLESNDGNLLNLQIESINLLSNDTYDINGISMHLYKFCFLIKFDVSNNYNCYFEQANLIINYANDILSTIDIGSFSYYKYEDNLVHLSLTNLVPIVKENEETKGFLGFELGFRNNNEGKIILRSVNLLDGAIKYGSVNIIDKIKSGASINDFFDGPNMYNKSNELNIAIDSKSEIKLAYKLDEVDEKWKDSLNNLGIQIEYEIDGKIYYYTIEKFLFYQNKLMDISSVDFNVYEYKNS